MALGVVRTWVGMVVAGVVLVWCPCTFALDPALDVSQYAHTAWKIREGFSKGIITSIVQTPDGYLWLGTEFGLLRFDGVRNVPWQPPAGEHLPSSLIGTLLVAHDGRLWIGTLKGLASWKDGKLTQYPELADQFIFKLLEDREGTVWVGTGFPSGRLCAIRHENVHCDGEDGSLGLGVAGLYEDSKGNLWVGVKAGLWRWRPGPPKFYPLSGEPDGIQALEGDTDGALLVGWKGGIHRFVDGKTEAYSLRGTPHQFRVKKILRDRNGGLWIGTVDRGVVHIHQGRTDVFAPSDGLSGEVVSALFEDQEGNIWVSTNSGLDRFRDFAVATLTVNQGLSKALIGSVLADRDGSVWLATYGGLDRWRNGQITAYDKRDGKLNGLVPNCLFQDSRGRIWVSTDRELGYLENNRFVPVSGIPGGPVHGVVEDTAKNLWIANQNQGLFHLADSRVVEQIPWVRLGHSDPATALAADLLRGGLWVGFYRGGVAYFAEGRVRESHTTADGLGDGRVASLRSDHDGTLWAATEGGLSRFKNGHFATLNSKNGLPCDPVHWLIQDDDQSFWLYMPCGLVRVAKSDMETWTAALDKDKDTKRTIRFAVFDTSDGVGSLAIAGGYTPQVAKSSDEKLWFLPGDGVSVVDPRHLPINKLPPPVHIEQVTADRKTYWQNLSGDASSSHPRLPPLVRDLEVDYTALSLVAPEKVFFRYKLEGWERDWQDAGNRRQAFYTNLSPGKYRFRVMACNNSGVWNEAGTFLDFSIAPAYYQTNWFRALWAAAFLGVLWALYQVRIQQVRRQQRNLRDVIETIPTFAWTALPDGSVDFVNRHWQEYTGLSTERTVGSGWHEAVHPEDLEQHAKKWRASLATGEPFENEVRYRRAVDGQYRWFLTRAVPLRDERGKILKWYGISTDIEERKQAEEALRQAQADLTYASRVSSMGELTASLAHEVKQPIAAGITNANTCLRWLAREQPDLEEARAAASRMVQDGRRASEIVNRVRLLFQKDTLQKELVDLNEIIREMMLILHSEGTKFSVFVRTELAADLPPVMGDRVQLQQVLMNLMMNSIDAMKDVDGTRELTIQSQRGEHGQVLISVSDTGMGLPPQQADKIFNAFFTTKTHGTGMGLRISRSIVESHGGRLWAADNSPRGATFQFTLPAATVAAHI